MRLWDRLWPRETGGRVIGVDTNVIVRLVVGDDPSQDDLVRRLVAEAGADGLFLTHIVLVEFNWVLTRGYRISRGEVLSVIEGLLHSREFVAEDRDVALEALELAKEFGCDYADALLCLAHERAGCVATATFDRKAQRLPQMMALEDLLP